MTQILKLVAWADLFAPWLAWLALLGLAAMIWGWSE